MIANITSDIDMEVVDLVDSTVPGAGTESIGDRLRDILLKCLSFLSILNHIFFH